MKGPVLHYQRDEATGGYVIGPKTIITVLANVVLSVSALAVGGANLVSDDAIERLREHQDQLQEELLLLRHQDEDRAMVELIRNASNCQCPGHGPGTHPWQSGPPVWYR